VPKTPCSQPPSVDEAGRHVDEDGVLELLAAVLVEVVEDEGGPHGPADDRDVIQAEVLDDCSGIPGGLP
jgi:hypothetical protein